MKNTIKILTIAFVIFASTQIITFGMSPVIEKPQIKILINGTQIKFENIPLIVAGRTMLPLRAITTELGVINDDEHIVWNPDERSVTILDKEKIVYLRIDKTISLIDGKTIRLDVAPMIYNDRTYVPVRFLSQALDKKVVWDPYTSSVLIKDMESFNRIKSIDKKIDNMMESGIYKITSKTTISVKNGPTINNTIYAEVDTKNKLEHSLIENLINKKLTKSETYSDEKFEYIKSLPNGKWAKNDITHELNEKNLKKEHLSDIFSAGLIIFSENEDKLVLEGNISFGGTIFSDAKDNPNYKSYTKLGINKKTYEIDYLNVTLSGYTTEFTNKTTYYHTNVNAKTEKRSSDTSIVIPNEALISSENQKAIILGESGEDFKIQLTNSWKLQKTNDSSEFLVYNSSIFSSLQVVVKNRNDLSKNINVLEYAKGEVTNMNLDAKRTSKGKIISIDNHNAVQYEVLGKLDNKDFMYLLTVIDTPNKFIKIVVYGPQSKFLENSKELNEIVESTKIWNN